MEEGNLCCCCLLRPRGKDLNSPYVYLGATETFSDMLEDCFQIQFNSGLDYDFGICEDCEGRLRDACDFKLQVQLSRDELRARLERARDRKVGDCPVKVELSDESDDDFMIQAPMKLEMSDDAHSEGEPAPCDTEACVPSSPGLSARARSQLAMACSVRLERLQHDTKPHKRRASPRTSPHQPRLTTHVRVQAEQQTERTARRDLTSGVPPGPETYSCDTCGEQFARKSDIVTHLKNHAENKISDAPSMDNYSLIHNTTSVDNSVTSEQVSLKSNTIPHKLPTSGKHTCNICGKQLTTSSSLVIHIRTHTGDKPYSCEFCPKRFTHKSGLTVHTLIHTGSKPYICDFCNKKFPIKQYLKKHIVTIHLRIKEYRCELCPKKYTHRVSLTHHKMLKHNIQELLTCDFCNKKFASKGDIDKHIRVHTGYKPYRCGLCSKSFALSGNLRRHQQTHTGAKPYACDICGKRYSKKFSLDEHTKMNHCPDYTAVAIPKQYSCEVCSKEFSLSRYLTQHRQIHTGHKSYICDICDTRFTHKRNLDVHILRVHAKRKT